MSVPVFFSHVPDYPIRNAMSDLCLLRWRQEPGAEVRPISPESLGVSKEEFQRFRRIHAEKSGAPFYAVVDDDCLLEKRAGESVLEEAVGILEGHPGFAVLSFWPTNSILGKWKADDFPDYEVAEDDQVMEHVSSGGIRICRGGVVKEWPPIEGKTYDALHSEAIREAGYRIGYYKELYMNHLGRWYSSVWGGGL